MIALMLITAVGGIYVIHNKIKSEEAEAEAAKRTGLLPQTGTVRGLVRGLRG